MSIMNKYTWVKLFTYNPDPSGLPLTEEQIRNKVPLDEQINEYIEEFQNKIQIENITYTLHSMSVVTESLVVFVSEPKV